MKKYTCFFCGKDKVKGKALRLTGPKGDIVYGCSHHPGVKAEAAAWTGADDASGDVSPPKTG